MIIVHDTFVCKPGNASKLAKLFKEAMAANPDMVNIMSDMTGQYHRVIMVSQYENMAAYEKSFDNYQNPTPEMKAVMAKMEGMNDMYHTGSREIYKVW
jgi:quinol monooxygenase YgiN